MKKLFLSIAIAGLLGFSSVSAQTKDVAMTGSKIGIGAEFAFPTGQFGDYYNFGYGASLQFQTPITNRLKFIATGGYLTFKGKDNITIGTETGTLPIYGVVPLKVGARYFLSENFYAGGELGGAIATTFGSGNGFIYTPHIGVEFPVADKSTIDFGARYEAWSNNGTRKFVGLRLAYNFGL
ncbi:MAG: hypothetical protein WKF66_16470 [Pedobacter sp.]